MQDQCQFRINVMALAITSLLLSNVFLLSVSARYLPTRSFDDHRLDKLKEILKDLLETDIDRRPVAIGGGSGSSDYGDRIIGHPSMMYKRAVGDESVLLKALEYNNGQEDPVAPIPPVRRISENAMFQ